MMNYRLKQFCLRLFREEKGEIILITLAFLLMGSLLIVPLVSFMGTGIKSGMTFNDKAESLYSADAGVEDAIWQIKYNHLKSDLTYPVGYDEYDYNTIWNYTLPEDLNQKEVAVTIRNVWIPADYIPVPGADDARRIIDDERLMVTGGVVSGTADHFHITVTYNPQAEEELAVDSIGVWLPPGFSYTTGTSNFEEEVSDPVPYNGGEAVSWNFSSSPITSFPGVDELDSPMTFDVTFEFTAETTGAEPDAISWIQTSGVADLPFSWDVDVKIYGITSTSGGTAVETYIAKSELRKIGGALEGDYYATGNTLMSDTNSDDKRDYLMPASDADVTGSHIPGDAEVAKAFLYWTSWKLTSDLLSDSCTSTNFSNYWTNGGDWAWNDISNDNYRGNHDPSTGADSRRFLTLKSSRDLSPYSPGMASILWDQSVSALPALFTDSCTGYTSWTRSGSSPYTNTSWGPASVNGVFIAHNNSGALESYKYLTKTTAVDLSGYSSGSVRVSWDQSTSVGTVQVFSDACGSQTTLDNNWVNGGDWSYYNVFGNGLYRATHTGEDSRRLLTLRNALNLSQYGSTGDITVSWSQSETGTLSSSDGLDYGYSLDGGNSWVTSPAFRDDYPPATNSLTIPGVSLPANFLVRFQLVGCSGGQYARVDNITVNVAPAPTASDGLDFALSADGGNNWSANIPAFRGALATTNFSYTIPDAYLTVSFKIRFYVTGFNVDGRYCNLDNIKIQPVYTTDDGLDLAFSADGGATWSDDIPAFRGNIGTTLTAFTCTIPSQYLSPYFKMRYYLRGFNRSNQFCYIDNITLMVPDNRISFSIDGDEVYFDDEGVASQGSGDLLASRGQVVRNYLAGSPNGYSYSCFRDVTDLVKSYTAKAPDPATNYPGYARYTVGDVDGSLNSVTSHAGWSLLLIYSSPATQGHQFFLYDTLMHCDHNQNLDFDSDGQPGGTISGFIVPAKIEGEINAAKITCFVGEGDLGLGGDYLKVNGTKLWDGIDCTGNSISTPNNIWNGESLVIGANDGIDIDTPGINPTANPPQYITWDSGIISSGDTSVTIDTYTDQDGWNLVYIILSFRNESTMGGSLAYLIRG